MCVWGGGGGGGGGGRGGLQFIVSSERIFIESSQNLTREKSWGGRTVNIMD